MTSERSKRCDFLSLIFISKSISKKLLIKKLQKKVIIQISAALGGVLRSAAALIRVNTVLRGITMEISAAFLENKFNKLRFISLCTV